MRRLVLARHGESEYNVLDLANGDPSVACGLTALGVEQARALGQKLREERIDLLVTSQFERARATAAEVLRGRDLPRMELAELNDPDYGPYEGRKLAGYRAWAGAAGSGEAPAGGGESRRAIVERYTAAFRLLAARPEETILAVAHSLPIVYALTAREGRAPVPSMPFADYATPYPFSAGELETVVEVLERWLAAPTF